MKNKVLLVRCRNLWSQVSLSNLKTTSGLIRAWLTYRLNWDLRVAPKVLWRKENQKTLRKTLESGKRLNKTTHMGCWVQESNQTCSLCAMSGCTRQPRFEPIWISKAWCERNRTDSRLYMSLRRLHGIKSSIVSEEFHENSLELSKPQVGWLIQYIMLMLCTCLIGTKFVWACQSVGYYNDTPCLDAVFSEDGQLLAIPYAQVNILANFMLTLFIQNHWKSSQSEYRKAAVQV